VSTLLQDLRYAFRSLLHTPSLTIAAVLSLGLGIGANTTVFSWVQAVLLRPVPGTIEPASLRVSVLETREGQLRSWSYPNYRDFRDRSTLTEIVAQNSLAMSISVAGQAERAYGGIVSGNYFRVLGVQPALGRLLTDDDDRMPGGHPVAVISESYWQRRFGGDPAVVGHEVTINSVPMTIVGVTLAAIGLYGVIAYAVSQRMQEMGIRLALGAAPGDVLAMVLRQGLVITSIGLVIGLALAFAATGFMRSLLPGVEPRDPLTFIGVPALLLAIAAVAALIPARRVGAVDPVVALRYE
jgi:hypothetical protein